jgi:hypothetical protein
MHSFKKAFQKNRDEICSHFKNLINYAIRLFLNIDTVRTFWAARNGNGQQAQCENCKLVHFNFVRFEFKYIL